MNDTEFRILDILSREIGNPMSINKLTEKIKQIHGTAYYTNIHSELQNIAKKKILKLIKSGKSTIAELNFENYLLIDLLSEMELIRKFRFLEKRQEFQMLIQELHTYIKDISLIKSVAIIEPERNSKLNRMELLFLLQNTEDEQQFSYIKKIISDLEQIHIVRIDILCLSDEKFIDLLKSDDANSAKEILSDKIILFYPQTFWMEIRQAIESGTRIKIEEHDTNPHKISKEDTSYNLARFGYKEIGTKITNGKQIGIEYIITSILLQGSARKVESIPIIVAKNQNKINYNLLVFLSEKYKTFPDLYGLLKAVNEIVPMKKLTKLLRENIVRGQTNLKYDLKDMEKKLRLYNVIE